jgi:hypothetical protein
VQGNGIWGLTFTHKYARRAYYFDTIMKDMSYEQIATIFRAGLISSSFFINPHRFYLCAIPMDSLPKPCSAIFVISVKQDSN